MADEVRLLTRAEVAALFRVDPRTVSSWATMGRLPSLLTPGGRRRFREVDVAAALGPADPPARPVETATVTGGRL